MHITISRLLKKEHFPSFYTNLFPYEHFLVIKIMQFMYWSGNLLTSNHCQWKVQGLCSLCISTLIHLKPVSQVLKEKSAFVIFLRVCVTFNSLSKLVNAIIYSLSCWILCTCHTPPARPEMTRYMALNN